MSAQSTGNSVQAVSRQKPANIKITTDIIRSGKAANRIEHKIDYGWHTSPFGSCFIATTTCGICQLSFTKKDDEEPLSSLTLRWPEAQLIAQQKKTKTLIEKIFTKKETPPLHLRGTEFQLQVWQVLMAIPGGETSSYQQVAQAIDRAKACRAVGSAVGANPIAYLIPCHRVILSSGELGNYHWGVDVKQAILDCEQ